LFNQADTILKQLLNYKDFIVTDTFHEFNPDEVFFTGDDDFDSGNSFDSGAEDPNRFDQGDRRVWLVKLQEVNVVRGLDTDLYEFVHPLSIKTCTGEDLIINSEFFVKNQHIHFLVDPTVVFKDNKFLITVGVGCPESIYRFPLGLDSLTDNKHIVEFARIRQSPETFKLAAASIGGLKILGETQKLIHKSEHKGAVTYTFESEIVVVDYPHTELTENKIYSKGTIIGDGIQLHSPNNKKKWWRDIDFKGGIALATVAGEPGILIPDAVVMAYVANISDGSLRGSKAHTRLDLIGDPDLVDAYWDSVEVTEKRLGRYVNDVVGIGHDDPSFEDENFKGIFQRLKDKYKSINAVNEKLRGEKEYRNLKLLKNSELIKPSDPTSDQDAAITYVNAIDVFFETILSQLAMVVIIDHKQVKDKFRAVMRFINKEQPVGCMPIIILLGPAYSDTYALTDNVASEFDSFEIDDSSGESTADLNSIIVDSYSAELNT